MSCHITVHHGQYTVERRVVSRDSPRCHVILNYVELSLTATGRAASVGNRNGCSSANSPLSVCAPKAVEQCERGRIGQAARLSVNGKGAF